MTARKKPAKLLPCPCGSGAASIYCDREWTVRCLRGWQCPRGIGFVASRLKVHAFALWNQLCKPRRRAKAGKGARRG